MNLPTFKVIDSATIGNWLSDNSQKILDIVANSYLDFSNGDTTCPDSYFLRFPDNKNNRIIAMPVSINTGEKYSGIKWIASYPENVNQGLDRASAVFILNCGETGYPLACLEGSQISSYRTAASAILGAKFLHKTPGVIEQLTIVGTGLIAHSTVKLFTELGWQIKSLNLVDLNTDRAKLFSNKVDIENITINTDINSGKGSDMWLFTTSATVPYVEDFSLFENNPTILHMSLRDLSTNIVFNSQNCTDNIDHALKANTSLHLAEQESGNRDFIQHDIVDMMNGSASPDFSKPRIHAPFGMGILDLNVAKNIYLDTDDCVQIENFCPTPYVL
ncbi:2,3-diaminopropionate biosynthesis protein SbnB [Photobacterium galatheae]|uniref:Ornithine cyclodeaminase n=1 Tax=Photobacterium galatheae TaxID=1654360 RepID=A0A066RWD5_9GAMM|nr:2,3-diaminopropionate biosynthesis protein SbnB [Photobacterium galatheae]KDM93431.1 hypothetical protein EA58_00770 [Photobacterium galatheae]MCM0147011.1 2,3-diaminopropionate biosynthesis protein SbnB [Photobacterium galatheae]